MTGDIQRLKIREGQAHKRSLLTKAIKNECLQADLEGLSVKEDEDYVEINHDLLQWGPLRPEVRVAFETQSHEPMVDDDAVI